MYTSKKAGILCAQYHIFHPSGQRLFTVQNAKEAETALLHLNAQPSGFLPGSINDKMNKLIHAQLDSLMPSSTKATP